MSTPSLVHRLREAGYKLTPSRLAVLQVFEAETGHLSPAQVLERARAFHPALSRATVYRTLELLSALGILRPLYLSDEGLCFTRADRGHHHLVCCDCGTVIEFEECVVEELAQSLAERLDFRIQGHLLEFFGRCENCHG